MIEHLAERVNANAALVRRGQYLNTTFLLQVGSEGWLVTIDRGRIASVAREGLPLVDHAFALRASREAWSEFWQRVPKPGFHDLIALTKFRHLKVEGDIKLFMTHLRYFKEVLAQLRTSEVSA
ncbi:hypothetical protein [Bradyrhizobium sp. LHD-71]|uniref:hypothetical protein n=1 Tax=Bradyrhizobium sp. LHD-71 TaxID=3072141 RepID=UPI00280C8A5D|nr:hypothetical protein [Bradyrhizobium sp. LHD-71]MDQ8732717.1 hypothetical protein [Bradyrhizobium sp. LHD-71]